MNKSVKKLALSAVVIALSGLSLNTYAAKALKSDSSGGDSGSLTQLVSQIYGQMQAGYTEANARLQQFDSYLNGFINSSTTLVPAIASTGIYGDAKANPVLAQPVLMSSLPAVVQGANSIATLQAVMGQIPSMAYKSSTGHADPSAPLNPNVTQPPQHIYLPWYAVYGPSTPTGALLQPPKSNRDNTPTQYMDNLTVYLPASDSFTAGNMLESSVDKTEAKLNNNYFNFMNYFAPAFGAYSTTSALPNVTNSDLNMAKGYTEFLSLSQQPVAPDLAPVLAGFETGGKISDPNLLTSLTNAMSGSTSDGSYQKFLLQERQYNAARSMIGGLLSQVWVERAPVTGAAAQVLSQSDDKSDVQAKYFNSSDPQAMASQSASPLQMERYIRLHRVQDPNWYKKMSTASPATIAREQLYVSAQILAGQQQAHEDSEKLLLATLLTAQGSVDSTMKNNLTMSENQLKIQLCTALGDKAKGISVCNAAKSTTSR